MTIERLRQEMEEVDTGILELVARRRELARRVGRAKDRGGAPLRDYAQEKAVLERSRRTAARLGLAAGVAEELMRALIRDALSVQESQRVSARAGGSGQRALVIGGAGRMGSWFCRFLASQGMEVEVADPRRPQAQYAWTPDWRQASLDGDLIVVATELRTSRSILGDLARRRPPGVVCDLGSLKTPLRPALEELVAAGVDACSVHPMFGPATELLSGRHVILVDLGRPAANRRLRQLFASTMAEVVEMSLDQHDRLVAHVLGLSHATNIAFFTALRRSGLPAGALARLASTTFDDQLRVARRVAQENPRLYYEIQALNQVGGEALEGLCAASAAVRDLALSGDERGFVELMEKGRDYLAELEGSAAVGRAPGGGA